MIDLREDADLDQELAAALAELLDEITKLRRAQDRTVKEIHRRLDAIL